MVKSELESEVDALEEAISKIRKRWFVSYFIFLLSVLSPIFLILKKTAREDLLFLYNNLYTVDKSTAILLVSVLCFYLLAVIFTVMFYFFSFKKNGSKMLTIFLYTAPISCVSLIKSASNFDTTAKTVFPLFSAIVILFFYFYSFWLRKVNMLGILKLKMKKNKISMETYTKKCKKNSSPSFYQFV